MADLRYDSSSGHLSYNASSGHLTICLSASPCSFCATGAAPYQWLLTLGAIATDLGGCTDCVATFNSQPFVLTQGIGGLGIIGSDCTWGYIGTFCSGTAFSITLSLNIFGWSLNINPGPTASSGWAWTLLTASANCNSPLVLSYAGYGAANCADATGEGNQTLMHA